MEDIIFIIDSKEKSKSGKGIRIFNFIVGLVMILYSLWYVRISIKTNASEFFIYSNTILYLLVGILFIIRGFIGRDFMRPQKYISLTNNSIKIKKQFKKEVQLAKASIEWIAIKPSNISIKTNGLIVDCNLNWISYNELQLLREKFAEFCSRNKIDIK